MKKVREKNFKQIRSNYNVKQNLYLLLQSKLPYLFNI